MTDYFMKIDGIPGDSTDAKHPNEIEVVSWSWGLTNTGSTHLGGGGGAGKADIQDLHFTARTSSASPLLFIACATGTHAKTADLVARKPGQTPFEFLKISLTDVLISSYQTAGNANDAVSLDQVSLDFAKVKITYIPQKPDGSAGTSVERGWDVNANSKF
jgi:type VI secretion system secreted protein Hcp